MRAVPTNRTECGRGVQCPGTAARAFFVLIALLGLLSVGCAGGGREDLPEFPKFEPADDFLAMQRRLQARPQRTVPQRGEFTERGQAVYDRLQERRRISESLVEQRARQREEALRRGRAANQAEWEAIRGRLARDEALDAIREKERASLDQRNRVRSSERFQGYRNRLEQLARRQEARAEELQQSRIRNLQRIEERFEALRAQQTRNLQRQGLEVESPAGAAAN